ncbi:MAG: DUF5606 domain-containing protein [Bacteroidales bacterium]|mgnify:FL=1|jgi:hypothetical protein|nr:DUF5606 domain-containing protein [Bacteroidales bacterium]MDD2281544.1 DUF5606 domain-containing protein [Bacteroidales bacterium]HNW49059.1 DUF5606 domain-containing protein [Bacteroidales bacterium]HPS94956.1 DUF5606 domain-containing protein [Bacteroidales bacterium]
MKTNLQKILSIAGQPGLFSYLTQANAGVVVESLATKKRTVCGMSMRISSLSDISVFTEEGEVSLETMFEKMKEKLGEQAAPSAKSNPEELKKFFGEVLPDYDRDKFYVSHMKKVVEWYNVLKEFASLDFEKQEEDSAAEKE